MADDVPVYITILEWVTIIFLVMLSGLFSGLNLGLMGLDPIGLQIVMASEDPKNQERALKIEPLRKRGNWLLCTLLIGNVAVNAALSILLAEKTSGLLGFFISTTVITIFGEIIPQALCSRYALEIGAKTIWLVWPLMWLMAVVAYPIAYLLDKALGKELGTVYSNKELQKLVEIHAQLDGTGVNEDTERMLKGALGLGDELVLNCMTEMKDVFWLSDTSKLSFDVLTEIFKSGHSRIPIFNTSDKLGRINCVGLLYVKDLILLDPDDEMPVMQIMNAFRHTSPPIVWKDDTLQHLLEIFVRTSQHLSFVQDVATNRHSKTIALNSRPLPKKSDRERERDRNSRSTKNRGSERDGLQTSDAAAAAEEETMDNTYEYVGIITLEDVIERVLRTQLVDEHDVFVDRGHTLKTKRLDRIDWNMLHIFDHRQRVLTTLPPQELQAVYHFLSQTVKPFTPKNRLVSEASIKNLLATSSVLRVVVSLDGNQGSEAGRGASKFGRRIQEHMHPDQQFHHRIHPHQAMGSSVQGVGDMGLMNVQHVHAAQQAQAVTQRDPYKDIEDNGLLLYQRDKKTRYFTLLLDGKCEIYAGRQGFRCELTRWSYLCPDALDHIVEGYRHNKPLLDFVPDFTAKVIENSRVLRIKLDDFRACLEGKFDFDSQAHNSPAPAMAMAMSGSPMMQPMSAKQSMHQPYFADRNQLAQSMQPVHSDPLAAAHAHASTGVIQHESRIAAPLMNRRAHSDGAIVGHSLNVQMSSQPQLPTPRNISDNTTPPVQSTTAHQPHRNPNYRLSLKNNLSNVQHMHFSDGAEHAQSHQSHHSPRHSHHSHHSMRSHSPQPNHSPRAQPLPQSYAQIHSQPQPQPQPHRQQHAQQGYAHASHAPVHSTQLHGNYSTASTQSSAYAQQQQQQHAQAYQVQQSQGGGGYMVQRGPQGGGGDDARHTIIEVAMDRDEQKKQSAFSSGVEGGKEVEVKEDTTAVAAQRTSYSQQHVYRDSGKRKGTMDNDEVAAAAVAENENSRSTHLYKQSATASATATVGQGKTKASNAEELNADAKQFIE